jgi:spermidine/putrescine-binding protein
VAGVVAAALGAVSLASCASEPVRSGRVVTVFGTLSDADVDDFMASVDGFESATGIDVRYVGSSNFEADLLNVAAATRPTRAVAAARSARHVGGGRVALP